MKYDVIIIGAGPGGIFSAYEMVQRSKDVKIAVFLRQVMRLISVTARLTE